MATVHIVQTASHAAHASIGATPITGAWCSHCTDGESMWIALGIILFIGWLLLKVVWNVASFAIYLLLAAAVIAFIIHFVRGHFGHHRTATTTT